MAAISFTKGTNEQNAGCKGRTDRIRDFVITLSFTPYYIAKSIRFMFFLDIRKSVSYR